MAADPARPRALRIARLLGLYARMDLLWIVRGTREAIAWLVADALVALGIVTTSFLLAARFDGIGAWSRAQVLFLLGFALLVRGAVDLLFNSNISHISRRIGRGQLDHLLLQPAPLWLSLAVEGFAPFGGSSTFLLGVILTGSALVSPEIPSGAGFLGLLALNFVASTTIVLAFAYAWGSAAFWAPRGAEEINSDTMRFVHQLSGFPLDGLPVPLLGGLLTVVPVGFVAWWPSRALLGLGGPHDVYVAPAAALLGSLVALALFRAGLGHYGRTGSQRYVDLGHRR